MPKQKPLLLRGGLTGRVYVVTRYTDLGEGHYESDVKYDVTEQYDALRAEDGYLPITQAIAIIGDYASRCSPSGERIEACDALVARFTKML